MIILQHQPGQTCTILLEILGSDGYRADGYNSILPTIERIIFPALSLASGFPTNMTRIDTGLFIYNFTLPVLATSVGTYIVDVKWRDSITSLYKELAYQIIVTAPYGMYTASVG